MEKARVGTTYASIIGEEQGKERPFLQSTEAYDPLKK